MTRLLPLVTVAAWAVMLWVPILASGDDGAPVEIVITSLGADVFDFTSARPAFLLIWIGVLTIAVTGWLARSHVIWSSAASILGILALIRLLSLLGEPPTLMWDGTADAAGGPSPRSSPNPRPVLCCGPSAASASSRPESAGLSSSTVVSTTVDLSAAPSGPRLRVPWRSAAPGGCLW